MSATRTRVKYNLRLESLEDIKPETLADADGRLQSDHNRLNEIARNKLDNVEIAYLVDPDSDVLNTRVKAMNEGDGLSTRVKGVTDVCDDFTHLWDFRADNIKCSIGRQLRCECSTNNGLTDVLAVDDGQASFTTPHPGHKMSPQPG